MALPFYRRAVIYPRKLPPDHARSRWEVIAAVVGTLREMRLALGQSFP